MQDGRLELEHERVDLGEVVSQTVASARPRATSAQVTLDGRGGAGGRRRRASRRGSHSSSTTSSRTRSSSRRAAGSVVVRLSQRDDVVCLEVSDTGIGIPEEERERLFERFFRSQTALERQIPGTGLGLYISKAIVEAHGGRIGVRGGDGEGTTFYVELPAAA